MSKSLDTLSEDLTPEAVVETLLAKPGRFIWMGIDGRVSNPFLNAASLAQIEQWLLDDYHTRLEILTGNDHSLVRAVPQLRGLKERLSSRIDVRVLGHDTDTFSGDWHINGEWLLTERDGVLYRNGIDTTLWQMSAHAPAEMRRLQRNHAQLWEHAVPSTELRSMTI